MFLKKGLSLGTFLAHCIEFILLLRVVRANRVCIAPKTGLVTGQSSGSGYKHKQTYILPQQGRISRAHKTGTAVMHVLVAEKLPAPPPLIVFAHHYTRHYTVTKLCAYYNRFGRCCCALLGSFMPQITTHTTTTSRSNHTHAGCSTLPHKMATHKAPAFIYTSYYKYIWYECTHSCEHITREWPLLYTIYCIYPHTKPRTSHTLQNKANTQRTRRDCAQSKVAGCNYKIYCMSDGRWRTFIVCTYFVFWCGWLEWC